MLIPITLMRGGTSRGFYFEGKNVPSRVRAWRNLSSRSAARAGRDGHGRPRRRHAPAVQGRDRLSVEPARCRRRLHLHPDVPRFPGSPDVQDELRQHLSRGPGFRAHEEHGARREGQPEHDPGLLDQHQEDDVPHRRRPQRRGQGRRRLRDGWRSGDGLEDPGRLPRAGRLPHRQALPFRQPRGHDQDGRPDHDRRHDHGHGQPLRLLQGPGLRSRPDRARASQSRLVAERTARRPESSGRAAPEGLSSDGLDEDDRRAKHQLHDAVRRLDRNPRPTTPR